MRTDATIEPTRLAKGLGFNPGSDQTVGVLVRSYSRTNTSAGMFHLPDNARIIDKVKGRRRFSTSEARG